MKNEVPSTVKEVKKFLEKDGHTLLYMTEFGGGLYGTSTENSDLDLKCVFLPSSDLMLCGDQPSYPMLKTNPGGEGEVNGADDVDLELWSIQKFMKMCAAGNTPALDMYFSYTNTMKCMHIDPTMSKLITNPMRILNPLNTASFVGFAMSQAKRYGVKGERLGVLLKVCDFVHEVCDRYEDELLDELRLGSEVAEGKTLLGLIIEKFGDGNYCRAEKCAGPNNSEVDALRLLGKLAPVSVSLRELRTRLDRSSSEYGSRTHKAAQMGGKDYKALSHALRTLHQSRTLIKTGKITFPLPTAKLLMDVKYARMPFEEISDHMVKMLDEVDAMVEKAENGDTRYYSGCTDWAFINGEILKMYEKHYK